METITIVRIVLSVLVVGIFCYAYTKYPYFGILFIGCLLALAMVWGIKFKR